MCTLWFSNSNLCARYWDLRLGLKYITDPAPIYDVFDFDLGLSLPLHVCMYCCCVARHVPVPCWGEPEQVPQVASTTV